MINRRQFSFWLGFGLFQLGETLNLGGLDRLAAAAMGDATGDKVEPPAPEHWTSAENRSWCWFVRETKVDGQWKVTGITTPVNKATGERTSRLPGYLDDSLVPHNVRVNHTPSAAQSDSELPLESAPHTPDAARRARHGRPPSRWLRSLHASELRIWLKTISPPDAGVEGMTFWEHLTRDHYFDPLRIAGLNIDEQAKLHAAAHHGY